MMADQHQAKFYTVKLGKASSENIGRIDSAACGVQAVPLLISVTCRQVPNNIAEGDFALIWLGSDNNKGAPTQWKQGFRAIAQFATFELGARHNDDSEILLSVGYIFERSLSKDDLLHAEPALYARFSHMPTFGIDDHANQTIKFVEQTLYCDIDSLLLDCDVCIPNCLQDILTVYPKIANSIEKPGKNREGLPCTHIIQEPCNLIYFGAPGTGKSYQLDKCAKENFPEDNIRRVTFYPEYTYSQFVGCYKPVSRRKAAQVASNEEGVAEREITYEFVPGPFLETYVKAWQNPSQNYLLIIEEINRANPAAVFGDLFQLLDRDKNGASEYPVAAPSDMRDWLEEHVTEIYDCFEILQLPPNLYIWATMNSADQGVFPMDTAFKRRWSFCYMGIDAGADALDGLTVELGKEKQRALWDDVRKGINAVLLRAKVNEDKLLGPFFIRPEDVKDSELFPGVFKEKVLLYLYEDAGKNKHGRIFADENSTYSQICDRFDRLGVGVFKDFPALTYLELEDGADADADGQDVAE